MAHLRDHDITFYYQNVRGMKSKTNEFSLGVLAEDFHLYLLMETWLNSNIMSAELFDDRYTIFRKDRNLELTV